MKKYEVVIGINVIQDSKKDPVGKRYEPGDTITSGDTPTPVGELVKAGVLKPIPRKRSQGESTEVSNE